MARKTPGNKKPSHPRDLYYPPRTAEIAQATNLDALSDVQISGLADADFLTYDSGTGAWVNGPLTAGQLPSHTHAAADVTSGQFANARIGEGAVTQHQAALTITESQISDLGNYAVVGHTHVEADITDLQSYLLDITGESLGDLSDVDLTGLSSTQFLRYTTGGGWQPRTLQTGDIPSLPASKITSGTFADARISQSSVTQHEGALTITESQISDLGSYITGIRVYREGSILSGGYSDINFHEGTGINLTVTADAVNTEWDVTISVGTHTHAAGDVTSGTFADARISQTSVTQHEAALTITESQISDLGTYLEAATNETVTGNWIFDGSAGLEITGGAGGDSVLTINADASTDLGTVYFETGGVRRWYVAKNTTGETGSNAGSDFAIGGYADNGAFLGDYLTIERSSGDVTMPLGSLTVGLSLGWGGGSAIGDSDDVALKADGIGGLSGVTITGPSSNDLLQWNGSAWVDRSLSEAGVAAASHTHTITDITDLDANYPKNVQAETISGNWDFTGDVDFTAAGTVTMDGEVQIHDQLRIGDTAPGANNTDWSSLLRFGNNDNGPYIVARQISADTDAQGLRIYTHTSTTFADPNELAMQIGLDDDANGDPDVNILYNLDLDGNLEMANGKNVTWNSGDLRLTHNGTAAYLRADNHLLHLRGTEVRVWDGSGGGSAVAFIDTITSSTSAPSGAPNNDFKGALHLIY